MKSKQQSLYWLIPGILLLLMACDAPRQNPFDPKAKNYSDNQQQIVTSKLFVKHLFPPFAPIANVNILIKNLHLFLTTNSKGYVTFDHRPVDSLDVLTDASGYFNREFVLPTLATNQYTIYLNAQPQVEQVHFTSTYTNLEQTQSTTNLSISASIVDFDGPLDIDTVTLKNDDYQFAINLTRDPNNNTYFSSEFNVSQIAADLNNAQLPELNFYFVVKNLNNDSIKTGPYSIRRVIETELKLTSPIEGHTVRDSIIFAWVNPEFPYDYIFNIELLKFPTFESIHYRNIAKDQKSLIIKNLAKGRYSWSLQVQDKLGNVCQSYYINFYYE